MIAEGMTSVAAHRADITAAIRVLPPRRLDLEEADGAVLAEDVLLAAGTPLGPAQVGLLAAAGQYTVLARPRPRLGILSAGNELAGPGSSLLPGQIPESNSFMLAAAARQLGCAARRYQPVRDDRDEVLALLREAAAETDLLVTTGGISMGGAHDVFKAALGGQDTVRFRRVAMRPGSPQGFGAIGDPATPILMLPGNPVSAFISFCLFAGPAVQALQGLDCAGSRTAKAVLTARVRSPAGITSFITAIHDPAAGRVAPAGRSSHQVTALARANALIIMPTAVTELAGGDSADVLRL